MWYRSAPGGACDKHSTNIEYCCYFILIIYEQYGIVQILKIGIVHGLALSKTEAGELCPRRQHSPNCLLSTPASSPALPVPLSHALGSCSLWSTNVYENCEG